MTSSRTHLSPLPGLRRAATAVAALTALATVGLTGLTGPIPAHANTPGQAGTPSAPAVVFTEDFENGQAGPPTLLTDYTGAGPLAETYTAAPAWLTGCNGLLVSQQAPATPPPGSGCGGYWSATKQMAAALGTWSGADPATNHAVTAYTQGDPGAGLTQLQTVQPIPLHTTGRFLTFSVDAAAQNCFTNHPLLSFFLLDGSTALPTSTSPIDVCQSPGAVIGGTSVGTYASNGSVLFSGSTAGIRLVNDQASGNGNDGAIDNIRLLDATPQLDLSASPAQLPVGAPAALTFTVTNTTELAAKNGWSFTAHLPTGLAPTAASPATTCGAGHATTGPDGSTLQVGGNLAAGQSSCTVTVQVSSTASGSYQLCAAAITDQVGVDPPGCASVTFTAPVFDARANGARLTSPLLGVGPVDPSAHECTTAPGSDTHTVVSAALGTLGGLGAVTTDAAGTIDQDGTRTATAHARTAGINLLAGVISADAVTTSAQARSVLIGSGPGPVSVQGSTVLTHLRVLGATVAADPLPNTTIDLPLVGSLVINQQTPVAGGRGITVTALSLTLLTGTHLTVGQSTAALLTTADSCPVG
ncbi:choice-of-anchor P family protein [Streptacidiphilus sp. N1-3]|uniref:Choice-of-anchor P family protein n=1 Tax=Streptacidiphilus alkalitolerans TaxID=3342712 RepID=A0ABV6WWC6_9ACTN